MEPATARFLVDQFTHLDAEQRREFLVLFSGTIAANEAHLIFTGLDPPEKMRFAELTTQPIAVKFFHILLQEAIRIARERAPIRDDDFDRLLHEQVRELLEGQSKDMEELERAELKEKRERKSDVKTIRRNVEICDLRRKNWSLKKLAGRFGMKYQTVQIIVKDEAKWRKLAAGQDTSH